MKIKTRLAIIVVLTIVVIVTIVATKHLLG
jgi:hypothetical protein